MNSPVPQTTVPVYRTGICLAPNLARVVFRPFGVGDEKRVMRIFTRVICMTEAEVDKELERVLKEFKGRHQKTLPFFMKRFEAVRKVASVESHIDENRKLLIGAYFTMEYSLESAALFNPSMVWHPDQDSPEPGSRRFIISLRATGEGHLSSISFREGTISADYQIMMDPVSKYVTMATNVVDATFDAKIFTRKMLELGVPRRTIDAVTSVLPANFSDKQFEQGVSMLMSNGISHDISLPTYISTMRALIASNYTVEFEPELSLSERVLFPSAPSESNGIEDARFVQFCEPGHCNYYATYSAYDGRVVLPQLIETDDFRRFRVHTLNGTAVQNKGFALFPRKINDRYFMLGRQDGENVTIMSSDHLYFWNEKQTLLKPQYEWEFVQLGNCGSPLETKDGWLVLTHGVGPLRKYAIGACLLDLNDPTRVIGRLRQPLLVPDQNEREGYVPNVVYSCGGQIHNERLIIPYAMSDYASSFATVPIGPLLDALKG